MKWSLALMRRTKPRVVIRCRALSKFGCGLTAFWCAAPVWACVVCIELPEETLTDRLWAADFVVFARPSESNSYVYAPEKVLTGTVEEPMPFLVDSVARRRMATRKDWAALILRAPDGTWELAGQGGGAFTDFVEYALAKQSDWTDEVDDPDRAEAFGGIHGHASPSLRRLALTELARLPYSALQGLEVALPVEWIFARTTDPAWTGWQPVLAQLLGLHSDPRAHDLVRTRALNIRPENRAPWLVALIEIDGPMGIERIVTHAQTDGTFEAVQAAIEALSIQASTATELAPEISSALRRLASDNPAHAAKAVSGFLKLSDYSFAPEIAGMLARGDAVQPADLFALQSYLGRARWGQEMPPSRFPALQSRLQLERVSE